MTELRAVFISYRREDAEHPAGRLFGDLKARFGPERVFIDVTGVELGRDFRKSIDANLASCGVVLAVIGADWLSAKDASGRRRLDDPKDFVRVEIATALKRDIPVIPILVQGATVPNADELPDDLADLSYRNGFELSHSQWESNVRELVDRLAPLIGEPKRREDKSSRRLKMLVTVAALLLILSGIFVYRYEKAAANKAAADRAAADRAAADRAAADRAAADRAAADKAAADKAAADRAAADKVAADKAAADKAAADKAAADKAAADKAAADKAAADKAVADKAAADKAAAQQSCEVEISSDPSGADVTVDGVSRGETRTRVRLSPGKSYVLHMEKANYSPYEGRIDCGTPRVDARLKQKLGNITVRYGGDPIAGTNCTHDVTIDVGNKAFSLSGRSSTASGVRLGHQEWAVKGRMICLEGGCYFDESGSIDLSDGGTYKVVLESPIDAGNETGRCGVDLRD